MKNPRIRLKIYSGIVIVNFVKKTKLEGTQISDDFYMLCLNLTTLFICFDFTFDTVKSLCLGLKVL